MLTSRRLRGAAGLGVAIALVTSACSSTTDGQGTAAPASGPTSFPSTSKLKTLPAGTRLSHGALTHTLLRPTDLPAGWTGKKSDDSEADDAKTNEQLAKCVGSKALSNDHHLLDVSSEDFTSGAAQLSSESLSFPRQVYVNKQIKLLHNPRIGHCFTKVLRSDFASTLPTGARVSGLSISVGGPRAGSPSNMVGLVTGHVDLAAPGRTLTVFVESALLVGPLMTSEVDAVGDNAPMDESLFTSVVESVAARTAKA